MNSLDLPATESQKHAIIRLCMARGMKTQLEDRIMNRREARDLIYDLRKGIRR